MKANSRNELLMHKKCFSSKRSTRVCTRNNVRDVRISEHPKVPNKPRPLGRGKTQELFDIKLASCKRSQVSIEYLIVVGFVSFAVITVLFLAYLYSGTAEDRIKDNQIQVLADKIINSAESVYYSGSPSQATITVYVPNYISSIDVVDSNDNILPNGQLGQAILIVSSSHSGQQKRIFSSNVNIRFAMSTNEKTRFLSEGIKKIKLTATTSGVEVSLV